MADLPALADRLTSASRRSYLNPYGAIDWPESLDPCDWYTSPELISLHGTPTWGGLDEAARKTLSFWEAVNFYSLNIHGEKALMEGLASRLYAPRVGVFSHYLHHFLDEENKHSIWFATFCNRYGGKIYPDRKVALPREHAEGEEDFLFFARVVIFEDIVDRYNVVMGRDPRLAPVARRINANHHADESRHIAFGRSLVVEMWEEGRRRWDAAVVERVRSYLSAYILATWRDYYNAEVYTDAGLTDSLILMRSVWEDEGTRRFRLRQSARCLAFLRKHDIVGEVEL